MSPNPSVVVFSGVEGILVNRRSGDFETSAAGALDLLLREQIPLVLCASKTRAEIERVYQGLGVSHPFVCESGAAVFVPRGYFSFEVPHAREVAGYQAVEFGQPYTAVVDVLHRAAERLDIDIVGFSDMSVKEVAADCDLSLLQARLAKLREYDEPFRIVAGDPRARSRLFKALHAAHLGCVSEGRYDRVGAPVDLGIGAQWLCAWYRRALGRVITVGLGKRLSHLPLLRRVDIPIVVPSDDTAVTARLLATLPGTRLTSAEGVASWPMAVAEIVKRAGRNGKPATSPITLAGPP